MKWIRCQLIWSILRNSSHGLINLLKKPRLRVMFYTEHLQFAAVLLICQVSKPHRI